MLGGAAALGIGYGGGGGNGKLSRERKHRMRELATQKLSQAYHLDEIAASVATMQSASTLEDVAQLVLQRSANDVDAKYVHFFHEKIPSRMMAQCTPLDVLNEIISERPSDGSPLRTRALTRIFKEDYVAAAQDLTEGLRLCRYSMSQHRAGKDQLVLARTMKEQYGRDWRSEVKVEEEDQPNSLETQLLFHRAGIYFTIACQYVDAALDGLKEAEAVQKDRKAGLAEGEEPPPLSPAEKEAHRRRLEARKQVKTNARRALKDYMAFLEHFDYTPGLSSEVAEDFIRRVNSASNGYTGPGKKHNKGPGTPRLLDSPNSPSSPVSDALVPLRKPNQHYDRSNWPQLPPPEIYQVSQLFSATTPSSLPPYPNPNSGLLNSLPPSAASAAASAFADSHEAITYHPLITDALHSLLLCHALLQTPPTELRRHAHNAARLARVCDGYPIFLAARSPARADWIEVLRRAGNWVQLNQSWESLCRPAPLPGHNGGHGGGSELAKSGAPNQPKPETEAQKRERQKHEAILDALADERVVDEESFQRAVRARERRAREDEEALKNGHMHGSSSASTSAAPSSASAASASSAPNSPVPPPKRWAQEDGKEYPISTERAEAISRWVREAPLVVEGGKKGKGKKSAAGRTKKAPSPRLGVSLEESVSNLSVEEVVEPEPERNGV
ncbi:uncharacterized protein BDZ99DRAFT_456132 [Mytilinidion resinicola]|uniref:Uncharacterized protein n=1 Tax=Mytilinidion resinicola TaxID=574789 RepID=A0A6A6XYN7_9PEZI|nr:uncharacterized protein BDZ99DRAFT_456132 [Mytilinidion resinicola]KAF2801612.1 hypothetical protein BDZ99DRAFT_456132 [Mytilinidion resinicola]